MATFLRSQIGSIFFFFQVTIRSATVKKGRFSKGLKVKYKVFKDEDYTETSMIKGTLEPEFNHSKVFSFNCITDEHLEFFDYGCITLMLFGNQEDVKPDPRFTKMSTKVNIFLLYFYSSKLYHLKLERLRMRRVNQNLQNRILSSGSVEIKPQPLPAALRPYSLQALMSQARDLGLIPPNTKPCDWLLKCIYV